MKHLILTVIVLVIVLCFTSCGGLNIRPDALAITSALILYQDNNAYLDKSISMEEYTAYINIIYDGIEIDRYGSDESYLTYNLDSEISVLKWDIEFKTNGKIDEPMFRAQLHASNEIILAELADLTMYEGDIDTMILHAEKVEKYLIIKAGVK